MKLSPSQRDFVFALLFAVVGHVAFFFLSATAVANDLIKGKIEPKEKKKKVPKIPEAVRMVYEEEFLAVPEVVPEIEVPVVAVEPVPEPVVEKVGEEPEPAFVQTKDDQEVEKAPENTNLIGARDTEATSDEGAKAGDRKMTALAGDEERKSDPKTFDSRFSNGESSGASQGVTESMEAGNGADQVNQERVESKTTEPGEVAESQVSVEETPPAPKPEKLPTIENALAALEAELGKQMEEKPVEDPVKEVEENLPQRPASEKLEASNQDGSFAPRTKKTRIAGVISRSGNGSLNVANTAVGRYQAAIFKKLETAWQMENIRNRSLLAPGNVTLYFVVNQKGSVSRQRQVSMVGASGTQWGMILRALNGINIPKMPKEVVKELEGDPLEIIVTFNY